MAGLLDGQIAAQIARGFAGKLLKGTLTRPVITGMLDADGDPVQGTPLTFSFEGFVEEYSEFTRQQAGIPQTDAKVNILAGSMTAGTKPIKNDTALINGQTYIIKQADTDPATALWVCQSGRVNSALEDDLQDLLLVYGDEASLAALLDQLEIFANTELADHVGVP